MTTRRAFCFSLMAAPAPPPATTRIWDAAPHNAFTDLIRLRGRWFCAFREGRSHVSPDGRIRILESKDGAAWTAAALFTHPTADLRDAKLSITPEGELMMAAAGAYRGGKPHRHQTWAWFSKDGRRWSEPTPIGDPDFWLWRVSWHKDRAYSVGYPTAARGPVRLYESADGRRFTPLVERLFSEGYANETGHAFLPDGKFVLLLRRDDEPSSAQLGVSRPPYRAWQWRNLGVRVGGPALLRLPDGRLLAGVRLYDGGARTSLCWLDPERGRLEEWTALPSAGDSSYPGLVWHKGVVWVSYYSSHEGKTSVYLARVRP